MIYLYCRGIQEKYFSKSLAVSKICTTFATANTGIAQLVEHRSPKPSVGSSSLSSRAEIKSCNSKSCSFCSFIGRTNIGQLIFMMSNRTAFSNSTKCNKGSQAIKTHYPPRRLIQLFKKNISDFFRFNYTSNRSYRKLNTQFIPKGNYDFFQTI